ncbi:MAG: VWA domain-containing protein [Bacilli bacterium]|nr:VWA domain-containing protein [Bacilli bacterium]
MEKLVELVFVLDMSGSMSGLEDDTIGGYNSILKKQREEGNVRVTTTLFNTELKMVHDGKDIKDVKPLTSEDYIPHGCTALYDAIGFTISRVTASQSLLEEDKKPSKTLMVITTDGYENSSREFTKKSVKALIEAKKACGWEFLFLGANIDAAETAEGFGISKDYSASYVSDHRGTRTMYCCIERTVDELKTTGKVKKDWKRVLEKDAEENK